MTLLTVVVVDVLILYYNVLVRIVGASLLHEIPDLPLSSPLSFHGSSPPPNTCKQDQGMGSTWVTDTTYQTPQTLLSSLSVLSAMTLMTVVVVDGLHITTVFWFA
uniref:Uncharacterized protein n=1 Tax=Rhipicephalus zambeziensis TaxID=60191 RepID=A0A224Y538_9ACAR